MSGSGRKQRPIRHHVVSAITTLEPSPANRQKESTRFVGNDSRARPDEEEPLESNGAHQMVAD
jgi:hypothetical protein